MNLLQIIWFTSLLLACTALTIMLSLIAARLLIERRGHHRRAERRRLVPMLIGEAELDKAALLGVRPNVVAELALELVEMVRGDERTAFLRKANALGVPEQLMRRLSSGSQRIRIAAVQGLARFDQPETRKALHHALEDSSSNVRLAAAFALTSSADPPDVGELIHKLRLDATDSSPVATSMFQRIAETRPEQIQALVMEGGCTTDLRLAALQALAATGDYSLVPLIAELATEAEDGSDAFLRYLHVLGRLSHPAARSAVLRGLVSPSMAARAAAAGAAGRIMLLESADRLVELLDDTEWCVRFRAAEALILLGEPGVSRLREVSRSGSEQARGAAVTMLAERGLAS